MSAVDKCLKPVVDEAVEIITLQDKARRMSCDTENQGQSSNLPKATKVNKEFSEAAGKFKDGKSIRNILPHKSNVEELCISSSDLILPKCSSQATSAKRIISVPIIGINQIRIWLIQICVLLINVGVYIKMIQHSGIRNFVKNKISTDCYSVNLAFNFSLLLYSWSAFWFSCWHTKIFFMFIPSKVS